MDQVKIGRYIKEKRKHKDLTQEQFAEFLGVSNRTVSRWETGVNMPDLSLLKEITEILEVTLMELLNGEDHEYLNVEDYDKTLEDTVLLKDKGVSKKTLIGLVFYFIGTILFFNATQFWTAFSFTVFGILSFVVGALIIAKKRKRIFTVILTIILSFTGLFIKESIWAINLWNPPIVFSSTYPMIETGVYKTRFYNYYVLNAHTVNEYHVIDYNKKYNERTLPKSPYNNGRYKYKDYYNNIKAYEKGETVNKKLFKELPHSESLKDVRYAWDDKKTWMLDYDLSTKGFENNQDLQKMIIFDSMILFTFDRNVTHINYNFRDKNYTVSRENFYKEFDNDKIFYNEALNEDRVEIMLEDAFINYDKVSEVFKNITVIE